MTEFDGTDETTEFAGEHGDDGCRDMDSMSYDERFVRISEDVVVDVLTGNQYMPMR